MDDRHVTDGVLDVAAQVLARCTVLGVASLLLWWGALTLFGDLAYSVHAKIAPMSRAQFDIIHYVGMLATKAGVSLLFFFPFIAIKLVIKQRKRVRGS